MRLLIAIRFVRLAVLVGLLSTNQPLVAGTAFLDDFEDGRINDGSPTNWSGGTVTTSGATRSLKISDARLAFESPLGQTYTDVSLQTQLRILTGSYAGIGARHPSGSGRNFYAYVGRDPGTKKLSAGIDMGGDDILNLVDVPISFDPQAEDIKLQIDIFGRDVRFWAWPASQKRPLEPLGTASNALPRSGSIFLFAVSDSFPQSGLVPGSAEFRYVQAALQPIPIPEPPTAAIIGLASGTVLARLRRRFRASY